MSKSNIRIIGSTFWTIYNGDKLIGNMMLDDKSLLRVYIDKEVRTPILELEIAKEIREDKRFSAYNVWIKR